jgi:response regulator RpfG family c-di-GMP phosphodiesterase
LDSAIAAVNDGQIFRFLTKPCPPDRLLTAFQSAVEQHRLLTAERVLLEQTLRGSIKMLTEVLALANPQAFGRANRIKDSASALAKSVSADALWEVEVAAMLSQIGCITLSASTVERLYGGWPLSAEDRALVESLPVLADGLLANIPRLEGIRACLVNQTKRFDGTGKPVNALRGEAIPLGARVLKIVMDFDELEAQGLATSLALDTMRGRGGWYDPTLLTAFALLRGSLQTALVREIPLKLVQPGMTFAEDVKNQAGVLLLPRGYEVTEGLLERIRNFQVKGNVKIIVKNLKQEG